MGEWKTNLGLRSMCLASCESKIARTFVFWQDSAKIPLSPMRRLVALLLLVSAPAAFAARRRAVAPSVELAVPTADSIAAAALAEGVPGMTVAVRKGDRTFTRAYGSIDREAN